MSAEKLYAIMFFIEIALMIGWIKLEIALIAEMIWGVKLLSNGKKIKIKLVNKAKKIKLMLKIN